MKGQRERICGLLLALLLTGCTPGAQPGPTASPAAESPTQMETTTPAAEETVPAPEMDFETLVTDRYHLEYDSPDNYRLDITLPLLREDLPGAKEINEQIGADYEKYLDIEPEKFYYFDAGVSYPMIRIHYEQYGFGDLLELVVRYECYSLYGSGLTSGNRIYCYDLKRKEASTLSRLMEELEISEEDVVDAYINVYGIEETERDFITFEDLVGNGDFFFKEEKDIWIEANA